MPQKAPGKHYRKGISLIELLDDRFPDEASAVSWFEDCRWGADREGLCCPRCGGCDKVNAVSSGKPMPFWCGDCRRHFSVRTGTVMERSKIPLRKWVIGIYLHVSSLKGVSSMKLHRDLKVTQKTAWFMAHRIREAWEEGKSLFYGPIEVDETYIGGLEKNKHAKKKLNAGRGTVGKTAVVGAKDRITNRIDAVVVESTDGPTLKAFVYAHAKDGTPVYTDEAMAYKGLEGVQHEVVKHSVGEYVDGQAHTNGLESFWSMLKRGYHGTFHKMSVDHLGRYVNEFSGRHNVRNMDTIDQMAYVAEHMVGKRLKYKELTA